ncbi:hypothetical protein CHUAL_011804 [Chamberlinius hualienensis]
MDETKWNPIFPNKHDQKWWISKLSFDWAREIVWDNFKGRNVEIYSEDAPQELKTATLRELMSKSKKNKAGSKLLTMFSQLFLYDYIVTATLNFIRYTVLMLLQIYFLGLLLYSFNSSDLFWYHRYVSAAVIIVVAMVSTFCLSQSLFRGEIIGAKTRIISSTLVFEKLLRIPTAEMKRINIGHVINLFASDVAKFEDAARMICSKLFDPLAVIAYVAYLQLIVGTPGVIGYLFLILIGLSFLCFSKAFAKFGRERTVLTDQRIKLISDMITEIRTMKMFCWEELYCQSIAKIRKKEMKLTFLKTCCRTIMFTIYTTTARISIYIAIVALLYMTHTINVSNVYMCFVIFNTTQTTVVILFARLIESFANALVSFERIQNVLTIREIEKNNQSTEFGPPSLTQVTSSWHPSIDDKYLSNYTLKDITVTFPNSTITVVTGPVGSGKSSLLLTLANELFIYSGKVFSGKTATYMPQEPWIFPSTVRQNILFGLPFDEQRYQQILSSCALDHDISQFLNGDSSKVDDKGLTLSGGQKARIALARAMYRNSDVYLLDDPLSAVDVRVGRHIWKNCFEASEKTIILVSHAVHLLNENTFVVNLFEGHAVSGKFRTVKSAVQTVNSSNDVDANVEETNDNNVETFVQRTTEKNLPDKPSASFDNCLLVWCRMAWNFANGYGVIVVIIGLFTISQGFSTTFDIMLSMRMYEIKLTNTTVEEGINTTSLYYLGLILLGDFFLTFTKNLVFFTFSIEAAMNLHKSMLTAITRTKMNFFNTHHTGQIINRFTKDVEMADEVISNVVGQFLRLGLATLGMLANTLYADYILSVPMVVFFILLGLMIHLYRKASQHYKNLEASARSPIYSYMNCSINGMAVIRSHENQNQVTREFDERQDKYSSISFLLKGIGFWVAVLSELCGNLLTVTVVALTIALPNYTNGGRAGVGIASALLLSLYMQYFKEIYETDTLFVSIERMVEYMHLPPEEDQKLLPIAEDWPKLGQITVKSLNLSYGKSTTKVLDDVNFEINPAEKIGIVGRTGAGKSSLIAALYQIVDFDGEILIDGSNIKTLNLSEYRRKLSIIPQNPVILSGSIRRNLDPLNEFSDEDVWSVLDDVHLKHVIASLPKGIEDGMDHFSVGQKQLFCLARTLLYNRKIIIFDEATSNIDNKTDQMIQELIKTKFSGSTLLVIAHRLQTVLDLDRIMVLHKGKIVEFDSPEVLLNNPESMFRKMVLHTKIDLESLRVAKKSENDDNICS